VKTNVKTFLDKSFSKVIHKDTGNLSIENNMKLVVHKTSVHIISMCTMEERGKYNFNEHSKLALSEFHNNYSII